ncbi:hypothetical protein [Trichormus azollae]|jgi:hypothetical protein|uniref:hypothetical protein n=1 Tax=Trichormus azollae TaxID=1164 RepID=UPI0001958CD9|nr:hypothetical protein [Trichormus azollae]
MDILVKEGPIWQKNFSDQGFIAISHYFVMDWVSVWLYIALELMIAGVLPTWVPNYFW